MCGSASDRMRACSCGSILILSLIGDVPARFGAAVLADNGAGREGQILRSFRRFGADVIGGRPDHPPGLLLLQRIGEPACRTGDGKDLRERVAWHADGVE